MIGINSTRCISVDITKRIVNDLVADVARAREELDGLRRPSRPFNPLTIIQVKNAERNLDDGGGGSGSGNCCLLSSYYIASHPKPKFIFTVSLLAGLAMIGLAVWVLPTHHCGDSSRLLCQVHASASKAAAVQTRLRRETYWTKSYDNISKSHFSKLYGSILQLRSDSKKDMAYFYEFFLCVCVLCVQPSKAAEDDDGRGGTLNALFTKAEGASSFSHSIS